MKEKAVLAAAATLFAWGAVRGLGSLIRAINDTECAIRFMFGEYE